MKPKLLAVCLLAVQTCFAWVQPGQKIWSFPTSEPILSSPTIAPDGTIYVGSYDRKIYALTPAGVIRWEFALPPPVYIYFGVYTGVYGTPALGADGTIYVPSENGKLIALNPTTGTENWTYSLMTESGLYASPAIGADGTIYFGAYDANFYALNPNGTRKWRTAFGDGIFASPSVGPDGTIYCGCDDGKLYALKDNGATATRKWTFVTGTNAITAAPAIGTNGTIYIGVGSIHNPKFCSVSTNGTTNWIFTTGSRMRSSAAIGPGGTIYVGCDDGKLYALNPNGTKKWEFAAGAAVGSSPAIAADGTIYFGCDDGQVYALNSMGQTIWTFATTDYVFASPAIGPDGTVYIASADGNLYLLRGSESPGHSSWPMYRYNIARVARAPGTTTSSNHPPALAAISDHTIVEGTTLVVTNSASDPDTPLQLLTFSLGPGAPADAMIDAASGVFIWTPTESQGPGSYGITVRVSDNGSPPLSDARSFTVTVTEANSAPVLASIVDRTIAEDTTLRITNSATDSDVSPNQLTFELDPGAPTDAMIDAASGVFTWTPTEAQGPGSYGITVRVTDNGSPPLSDTGSFTVTVTEANSAPVLAPIVDRTIAEGTTLRVTNSATDSDIPRNQLTFELDRGAPADAMIDAASGVFTWTPTEAQRPGSYGITVRVTDDGSPSLSDMKTFTVIVISRPRIESITASGGTVTISWSALAGQRYHLQYKTKLDEPIWNDLAGDLTATSDVAAKSDTPGLDAKQRFYRVELLP